MTGRHFAVREEYVPPEHQLLPPGVSLGSAKMYPAGTAQRWAVINAYPADLFSDLNYEELTSHERWAVCASRAVAGARAVAAICDRKGRPAPGAKGQPQMHECYPAGYLCEVESRSVRRYCCSPVCLFCHARSVSALYVGLCKAYRKRPPDSAFYAGRTGSGRDAPAAWASKWFRKHRTAGGVAYRYRSFLRPGYGWMYSLIAVSDSHKALTTSGIKRPIAVQSPHHLAYLAARWLPYPKRWAVSPSRAFVIAAAAAEYESLKGTWRYREFGACADDYVSGKSWCDFAGFDGGIPGKGRNGRSK